MNKVRLQKLQAGASFKPPDGEFIGKESDACPEPAEACPEFIEGG